MLFDNLKNRIAFIPHAFGLDISDTSIKFFQLSRRGNTFDIEAYGQHNIKNGLLSQGFIKDLKPTFLSKLSAGEFSELKARP